MKKEPFFLLGKIIVQNLAQGAGNFSLRGFVCTYGVNLCDHVSAMLYCFHGLICRKAEKPMVDFPSAEKICTDRF